MTPVRGSTPPSSIALTPLRAKRQLICRRRDAASRQLLDLGNGTLPSTQPRRVMPARRRPETMKSIFDPSFRYVSSLETDLRKTFARIRHELTRVKPVALRTKKTLGSPSDVAGYRVSSDAA